MRYGFREGRGVLVGLALLAVSPVGCGGDEPGPAEPTDGATDGDGGPSGDRTPPTFAGLETATATSETAVTLTWKAATDDTTEAARIAYRIYVAEKAGGGDFKTPWATSPAGSTSFTVTGLLPGQHYWFVARAVDGDGNEDGNIVEKDAATTDTTPPKFAGVVNVTGADKDAVEARWAPATDDGTKSSAIRYRVFLASKTGTYDFTKPDVETSPGATSAIVKGLEEAKTYALVVRAVDASGNMDDNLREKSGQTLDKTAPIFEGLFSATAIGTSIKLLWNDAKDNVDAAKYLRYEVYRSTIAGKYDFTKPVFTTAAGITEYTATGLDVSTTYFFTVRARDSAGNLDGNAVEKSAKTAASPDILPPTFGGLDTATALGARSVDLRWTTATDDTSKADGIFYDVFVATTSGGEDFSSPSFSTLGGATSFTLTGLSPLTSYYVVVRARDQAGNQDKNTVERVVKTLADTTPPTFGGVDTATTLGPTSIRLTWSAASDDVNASGEIVYKIFAGASATTIDYGTPLAVTDPGVTTYPLDALVPGKTYFFVVRAVDAAGNVDSNTKTVSAATLADTKAPVFDGLLDAVATSPTSLLVTWKAATDDVTAKSAILYDLYTGKLAADFTATPTYTSTPGATSYVINGLSPKQVIAVGVRARDAAGNRDANTVTKSVTMPADATAPTFAGAKSVTGASSTSLTVVWDPATDDVSAHADMTYLVCRSLTATGCLGGGFLPFATVTGGTSYTFTGLSPTKDYYFRVLARDGGGNIDANTSVVSGKTVLDGTPPTFGGCGTVAAAPGAAGASALAVSWTAATDDVSGAGQLVYSLTWSTSPALTSPSTLTTAPGATSAQITGLAPATTYYVRCRAVDVAGNSDANTVVKSAATTADTFPPTFGGLVALTSTGTTSLALNWAAASDTVTATPAIAYDICYGTLATDCNPGWAVGKTVVGTTSTSLTGLTPGSTYYVRVRARDGAGNLDGNTAVLSKATDVDVTPPVWGGGPTVSAVYATGVASSQRLSVTWNNASDVSAVRYRLCWSTTTFTSYAACSAGGGTLATTAYGATNHTITGLSSRQAYSVSVRAEDAAGNVETGGNWGSATTATSYTTFLSPIWTTAPASGGCAGGCHSFSFTYAGLTAGYSSFKTNAPTCTTGALPLVVPGSAFGSALYRKMTGNFAGTCVSGTRMPSGGTPNATYETYVNEWITQGAWDN